MKKIIAIGGGKIEKSQTTVIDQEIIRLTGKTKPTVLFIPTASSDPDRYVHNFTQQFGKKLGCSIDVLYLIKEKPTLKEITKKIFDADSIYVGGGNTLMMMKVWRKLGVDTLLKQAHERGIVLSGVSAGAICWFKSGNSDSLKFKNPDADYIKVSGLGLVNLLCCPHYDGESDRQPSLKAMMHKTSGVAIALDDCAALEIIDDQYRIISSKKGAQAYKVYWKQNKFYRDVIEQSKSFAFLKALLKK